ncbi:MAG: UvrD-helicase domain-containing protein [Armatimonadota bacterium]
MLGQVSWAKTFQDSLKKLSPVEQKQVKVTVYDFFENPTAPGHSLHQVDKAPYPNWWSLRVNDDLRIILAYQADAYILCYVDHHEEAYRWARRRRFEQDVTGSLRVVLLEEEIQRIIRRVEVDAPLSRYEREYLVSIGIPSSWVDYVRHASEEELIDLIDEFPEEVWERVEELLKGKPVKPPERAAVENPLRHPDSRRRFWTPASLEELQRSLELPWEKWLVYLHPLQREAVEAHTSGPARVSGGAGTGKTVVAVHRAAELSRRYPKERILLTTFTRTLAQHLRHQLQLLTGKVPFNVTVANLHSLARSWCTKLYADTFSIAKEQEVAQQLESLRQSLCPTFSSGFVRMEWERVIEPWNIRTLEQYLNTQRIGRKAPLRIEDRRKLWHVFEALWQWLDQNNLLTWSTLCYRLAGDVSQLPKYRCIVVDEAQDFGPAELMLIRTLCPENTDDLFLCADAEQRIYRTVSPWSTLGIHTRGRSTRLRVNYRTTRQIQHYAERILPEYAEQEDDLLDETLSLRPLPLLRGEAPRIRPAISETSEAELLAEWLILRAQEGYRLGEMGVFARTRNYLKEHIVPVLEKYGLPVHWLDDHQLPDPDHINVGTAHRAKGLEFKVVAVVGVSDFWFPLRPALNEIDDPVERMEFQRMERQLLYVACTRAREKLWVSYFGAPSPFLPPVPSNESA